MHVFVHKVISGQQLPKVNQKEGSIVDPLVRVEIYGVFQDQAKQETSYIDNNGEGPAFKDWQNTFIGVFVQTQPTPGLKCMHCGLR